MRNRITLPYFPKGLQYTTPLPLLGGAYLLYLQYYAWGVALLLLSLVFVTTKYVTEIDMGARTYKDYLYFLGLHLNQDVKHFNRVDRIIITKGNYSQTLNSRIMTHQMDWSDYTGTLITDNDSLDLLTHIDKRQLVVGLKPFADFLKVGIEDRTTNRFYWVDIDKVISD